MARAPLLLASWLSAFALCSLGAVQARGESGRRPRAAARTDAVLAASARELAAGRSLHARRLLEQALRRSSDVRVLLRYAELALPFGAVRGARDLPLLVERAPALAQALEQVDAVASTPEALRLAELYGAFAYALLDRFDDALTLVFEAGRLQDPTTVLCLRAMAAVAAHREQLPQAERVLALARQYVLQDVAVMAELGRVQLARGRSDEALAVLGERFAIEPLALEARRDLAYALLVSGRPADALSLLSAVEAACLAQSGCALEAARAALEAEQPERAVAYARARLSQRANDLDAQFIVADAHMRSGELEAARSAYADVLRAHPESVRAKQALERLSSSNERAH